MRFRVLGPLEVWEGDQRLTAGGPQQRALLAVLLLHANRVVSNDRLIDYLWDDRPPPTARGLLQGCVAGLRRVLRPSELQTRPPGYLLEVDSGELDLDRLTSLEKSATELASSQSAPDLERAATMLAEALALWRGPALSDIPLATLHAEATQLEERRLALLEDRIEVELRLGRHAQLVSELPVHIQAHPLRERLWAQLMLALYAADRQADALDAYRRLRQTLIDEIGVEPGPAVRELQQDILACGDAFDRYVRARPGMTARDDSPTMQGEPAQLPGAPSAFTGRIRQLKALDELLSSGGTTVPVGLITGTAGVGKTALAVHWAHQVRDRFTDGQLYADLRGYAPAPAVQPEEALTGLLRALGLPGNEIPADLDAAAGLYRTLLASKRVLLLLDNAASVEQVRPLLPASATCLVLVTSRDRLAGLVARDGAQPIVLDVLDPAEATALLGCVLGSERVDAEPEAAAELAQFCALLPLALRIAAANLAFRPRHGLSDQLAELSAGDRLSELAVAGDERSAVRLAFDLSYATLDPAARRLFRLLGLVPGPDVTAEAAAALTDLPVRDAARLLERLAGAHLISQYAAGRYTFHDLLRLYAAERAATDSTEAERAAATTGLFDWYVSTTDAAARLLYPDKLRLRTPTGATRKAAAFGSRSEALAWLDEERPNLVAAARHAADHSAGRFAWLLADALRGYFQSRFVAVDWLVVASAARAAAEAEADLDAQAVAELNVADLYRLQGAYDTAIGHFGRAAELARRSGWLEGESAVLGNLGIVHQWSGRPLAAADHYRRALEIDRRTGWLAGQHVKLGNLATVYLELGRLTDAFDLLNEAIALGQDVDQGGEAIALSTLAETCRALGRLDEALEHLDLAIPMLREIGDRGSEAQTLGLLASVHRDAGRLPQALDAARDAVAMSQETGNARFESHMRYTLGTVYQRLGRYDLAVASHESAIRLARESEARLGELNAQVGLAVAFASLGRYDQAQQLAGSVVVAASEAAYPIVEAEALAASVEAALGLGAAGAAGAAVENAQRAAGIFRRAGDRMGLARALLLLGRALNGRGERAAATERWREALAVCSDLGVPEAAEARSLLRAAPPPS